MNSPSPYRFAIVAVVALAAFLGNFVIFQMAGLAPLIIEAANLDPADFGLVIGISMLTAAIFGIPLGALGDRVGVKPVVAAAIAITLIGSIGRYLAAPSLGSYLFWMFLIGGANAALNANFIKVLGLWLPPGGLGVGVGLYLSGIGLGQTVAIAASSRFSGMGSAFLFAAILSAAVLAAWLVFIKNPPGLPKAEPLPMASSLKRVMKMGDVWIGGVGIFFFLGTYVAATSFTGTFLTGERGAAPKTAALMASLIAFCMLVGALLNDRLARAIGSSRVFLLLSALLAALGTLGVLVAPLSLQTIALLAVLGFGAGAYCSFVLSLPMLLKRVGPALAGSAGGLISSLQSLGGFALPYAFPVLAGGDMKKLMAWIAAGFVLMGAVALLLPELVKKAG